MKKYIEKITMAVIAAMSFTIALCECPALC